MAKGKNGFSLVPAARAAKIVSGKPLDAQPGFVKPMHSALAALGDVFSGVRQAVAFAMHWADQTMQSASIVERREAIREASAKVIGKNVNAQTLRQYVQITCDAGLGRLIEGAKAIELPKSARDARKVVDALSATTRAKIGRKEKKGNAKKGAQLPAAPETPKVDAPKVDAPKANLALVDQRAKIREALSFLNGGEFAVDHRYMFQADLTAAYNALQADDRARQATREAEAAKAKAEAESAKARDAAAAAHNAQILRVDMPKAKRATAKRAPAKRATAKRATAKRAAHA